MKIDLINGLNIEIGGELGKRGAISIKNLTKLGTTLQELVLTLAKHTIESSINLTNFELDLTGIKKCCTVLEIKYSPSNQQVLGDVDQQRLFVSDQLDNLIKLSHGAEYLKLREIFPDGNRRNAIVNDLYDFTSSLGNAAIRFMEYDNNNVLVPVYKIRRFKPDVRDKLLSQITTTSEKIQPEERVGHILVTKVPGKKQPKKKILDYYESPDLCVAFNPKSLRHYNNNYIFTSNLMCEVIKEGNSIFIKNSMLDLIGVGETQMDAEIDFAEEFDFIYRRCNELPDEKLTDRLISIKKLLNIYVKQVEK
jgi:hypothetical protein